ncbi:hypothetical protein RIF29_39899 [Crotalaria pallida]|uniref:C2H2-type domain-containing protein n=1 Tax=Crotalaria pallida TaxID=3830 RepID=A0AAN9E245_CROPI
MQVQEEQQQQQQQQHVLSHMQMIKFKGKRTKRQRLPSPLRLALPSTTSSTENSEEEEDMANCLILLAQGRNCETKKAPELCLVSTPDHNNKKKEGFYLYECKTCNRCFPSFQALGGHRASHKKPKANTTHDQKHGVITSFVNDRVNDHYYDPTTTTTNTTLTLQIPNNNSSAMYGTNTTRTITTTKCNKVHECSICGAEFISGQALGGHMRRHRSFLSTTSTTTTTTSMSGANIIGGGRGGESPQDSHEMKRPRNVLKLDLNLPAPEDDHKESKLSFQSSPMHETPKLSFQTKEKVIAFNTTSLVDCHY